MRAARAHRTGKRLPVKEIAARMIHHWMAASAPSSASSAAKPSRNPMIRLLHCNRRAGNLSVAGLPGLGEDAQRGEGGGFGAQDICAERDGFPAGSVGKSALAVRPAAFGACEDGDGVFGGAARRKS